MTEQQQIYWKNVGVASVMIEPERGIAHDPTDEQWGGFLVDTAVGMAHNECDEPGGSCEVCELFQSVWWGKYADLPRFIRMSVQRALIRTGVPLPTNPHHNEIG